VKLRSVPNVMQKGDKLVGERGLLSVRFAKKVDALGDRIIPFYCKNCGFIEIYKEMKRKKD